LVYRGRFAPKNSVFTFGKTLGKKEETGKPSAAGIGRFSLLVKICNKTFCIVYFGEDKGA
jgi:hypothetical protein